MEETRIKEFLKSMRLVFVNAGVYRGDHPLFKRSLEQFLHQFQSLASVRGSIDIGIKPQELIIGGKPFKNDKIYSDTADFFHVRKIKMIVIRPGVTTGELMTFFLELAVSPQQLHQSGGAQAVLKKKGIIHIGVESLDYSPLLNSKQDGPLDKDIWDFLLKNIYTADFSKNETKAVSQLRNVLEELDLSRAEAEPDQFGKIKKMVAFLKEKWPDKAGLIDQEFLRASLGKKSQLQTDNLVSKDISELLKDLDPEKALDVLWEKVFDQQDLSSVVFNVFSRLTGFSGNKEINSLWEKRLENSADKVKADSIKKKVEEILVLKESDVFVSEMYNSTLSFLSRSLKEEGSLSFEEDDLIKSGLYVWLNMFAAENDPSQARLILEAMIENFEKSNFFSDGVFLSSFLKMIDIKIQRAVSQKERFFLCDKKGRILARVEKALLEEDFELNKDDFETFMRFFRKSFFGRDHYLKIILENDNPNSQVLRIYTTLFSDAFDRLSRSLRGYVSDPRSFIRIVDIISGLDDRNLFKLLRELFPAANSLLQSEMLKKMHSLSFIEKDFIFENIGNSDPFIKREAVKLLGKLNKEDQCLGLSFLFSFFNPLGLFNDRLCENIRIVGEAGLKNALPALETLRDKRFIFKADQVRKEADAALKKLRKDEP